MLVLDTNHVGEIEIGSPAGRQLARRLEQSGEPFATTVITVEEQLRGWLAQIARKRETTGVIRAYARLHGRVLFYASWTVLPWGEPAAAAFTSLQRARPTVGTLDLRIASIVIANDGLLLTRNLRDFGRIAGLRVEDWLAA